MPSLQSLHHSTMKLKPLSHKEKVRPSGREMLLGSDDSDNSHITPRIEGRVIWFGRISGIPKARIRLPRCRESWRRMNNDVLATQLAHADARGCLARRGNISTTQTPCVLQLEGGGCLTLLLGPLQSKPPSRLRASCISDSDPVARHSSNRVEMWMEILLFDAMNAKWSLGITVLPI